MKGSFIILFLINWTSIFAQDILYPEHIDVGEFNIRKHNFQKEKTLISRANDRKGYLINNSDEILYLLKVTGIYHYDENISKENYVKLVMKKNDFYGSLEKYSFFPNDTILLLFVGNASYVDTVSKSGVLNKDFRFYYRKESSTDIDSFEIRTDFKVVDRSAVEYTNYSELNYLPATEFGNKEVSTTLMVFNCTEETVVFDSLTYEFDGLNFQNHKRNTILAGDDVVFPFEFNKDSILEIYFKYKYIQPEESRCHFKIYAHGKDSGEDYTFEDTMLKIALPLKERVSIKRPTPTAFYLTEDNKAYLDFEILNETKENWQLVDLSYTSEKDPQDILTFEPEFDFPLVIPPGKEVDVKFFRFHGATPGHKKIIVDLTLQSESGDSKDFNVVFYIEYIGLPASLEIKSDKIVLSPNPANDVLNIITEDFNLYGSQLVIYDIFGRIVLEIKQLGSNFVNIGRIPPGTYNLLRFNSKNSIKSKLQIVR